MSDIGRGWLLIADITGYTAFMARTDLTSARPIVDGLMGLLIDEMHAPLTLVKAEGDAVFGFAPADAVPDPMALVSRVEDLYYAFRMALVTLGQICTGAPDLDLKVVLHFGEYAVQRLGGTEDLAGRDVILVHRLTKNRIIEQIGYPAYLAITDAALAHLPDLGLARHEERYAHFGPVGLGVLDLDARFAEMQAVDPTAVGPDEAVFELCYTVPAPPSVAWSWHVDGDKRARWEDSVTEWHLRPNDTDRIGLGTGVECVHADGSRTRLRITGWRPYRGMTLVNPAVGLRPAVRLSYTFEPGPDGTTRVTLRVGRPGGLLGRVAGFFIKQTFGRATRKSVPVLNALLEADDVMLDGAELAPMPS